MGFFDTLRTGGDEVEGWTTIGGMKAESDIVGLGRFVSFGLSRTIQGDAPEDVVAYGKALLQLNETISGKAPDGLITVEFILPGNPAKYEATVEELERSLPTGDLLVFLRHKGGREAGLYRLVNSNGLWTSTTRAAVDAPFADSELGVPYASELGALTEFDQLVSYVKSR